MKLLHLVAAALLPVIIWGDSLRARACGDDERIPSPIRTDSRP
jgi:hypothetical protein